MAKLGSRWRGRLLAVGLTAMAVSGQAVAGVTASSQANASPRAAVSPAAVSPATTSSLDWSQYLHGPQHSSVSPATAFTPANAASANALWNWKPAAISGQPQAVLLASPTVVAGRVYVGAGSGRFYALSSTTGAVVWSRQLDTEQQATCPARGITATASVLPDPVTGVSTVYVSGARYLYALNAATGAVAWKTEIGPPSLSSPDAYYNWSSPTVAGGHVYVGLSSSCDVPLIRGGVVEIDQHTGHLLHTWYSVPPGSTGGSVWSSVAALSSGSGLWVSTGNECDPTVNRCPPGNRIGHSLSIVHLSSSLVLLESWQVAGAAGQGHDWDFGSSPTLFGGSGIPPDVGACNKNGKYYALSASPLGQAPLWADTIGAPAASVSSCLASAVFDGHTGGLYISGDATTVNGTAYGGSVRRVDPSNGSYLWQAGLPCAVMGTPSLDGAGVLAAGTYSCPASAAPGAYLIDASTGNILDALPVGSSRVFAQPVFAQGNLFVATQTNGLYDFAP